MILFAHAPFMRSAILFSGIIGGVLEAAAQWSVRSMQGTRSYP